MMKKFKWRVTSDYPGRGPVFYASNKVQYGLDYQGKFIEAHVSIRTNGPNTAFARITLSVEWASNEFWGVEIYSHFNGRNAGRSAKAWCNYHLNHPPTGWQRWKKKK